MNNSYQHDKNLEIKSSKYLISKFCVNDIQAKKAIKKIYANYSELEKKRSSILDKTTQNTDGYYDLCKKIHSSLYKNILSNAGQFRKISDPNGGNVYFGFNQRTQRERFIGTEPKLIESELKEAFGILFNAQYKPPEKAIRFYAEFVAIHPFYDANGRIGRYIVDIFLQSHNYYVDWQSLNQRHGKFLRKLNFCHSVRAKQKKFLYCIDTNTDCSQQNYYWICMREKYICYLLSFWNNFIKSINDLETS